MLPAAKRLGRQAPQLLSSLSRLAGTGAEAVLVNDGSCCSARGLQTAAKQWGVASQRAPQLPYSFQLWTVRGMASYPPHTLLDMPALSPTMSQGNIAAWKKQEGEEIAAGDVLCEVETDKATMEWEAQDEGFLAKILMPEGSKDVPVGTHVAVVVDDADSVGAFKDFSADEAGGAEASGAAQQQEEGQPPEQELHEEAEPEEAAGSSGGDFPPHQVQGLPALSPTMSQGNIAKWNKKEGEPFAAGDSLAEVETDKATMDWEAQDDGFIAKLLVDEGAKDISVGQPVLVTVEDEDAVAAFKDFSAEDAAGGGPEPKREEAPKAESQEAPKAKSQGGEQKPAAKEQAQPPQQAPKPSTGQRVKASPYARKLAAEAGVDVSQATPTGPEARIVAVDVQKLIESGGGKPAPAVAEAGDAKPRPAAQDVDTPSGADGYTHFKDVPLANIKRITAQRLLESKQTIPHYYLTIDCKVDKLVALRHQLNEALAAGQGGKLSVNDFVIKAAALALRKVPQVNASWRGDYIREFLDVNIGVAVQTDVGLLVPVLPAADAKGLGEISKNVKELAGKAREGKLKPTDFDSGTFTISNLGMFGVEQFAAIINPPQAAILAVGATQKKVVTVPGGFAEASVMSVTMSCDHRVVDGALGAMWLQAFRANIEDPVTMLL